MSTLSERCYELLQQVPRGKVTTYKILAHQMGVKSYRSIGQLMKRNPKPIEWPCHRVVMSNGNIGGFLFGQDKKAKLLEDEGIQILNNKVVDIKNRTFYFYK